MIGHPRSSTLFPNPPLSRSNAAADVATPTASGVRPKLMEWGLFLGAATASTFSLRRTSALGTRTTPTALVAEDAADETLAGRSEERRVGEEGRSRWAPDH